jgi:chromosome segregation ATPase
MWQQLFNMAKRLMLLVEETGRNRADIEELQRQVREMATAIEQLRHEIHRVSEKDEHEREKLVLLLENALLKFERRLPPAKHTED